MTRWLGLGMLISVGLLASCGGDDDGGATECAPGVGPTMTMACTCADGVTMSTRTCGADGTFGACNCAGGGGGVGGTSGTGGTTPIDTAGTGGASGGAGGVGGAGTGGSGGTGGTGGTGGSSDQDGGDDDGGTAQSGAQNSPCTNNGNECSGDLVCYLGNHCSAPCSADSDCNGVSGADYTCYTMDGVCRVICADDNDCPPGLECQNVTMGGGSMTLRCMLP